MGKTQTNHQTQLATCLMDSAKEFKEFLDDQFEEEFESAWYLTQVGFTYQEQDYLVEYDDCDCFIQMTTADGQGGWRLVTDGEFDTLVQAISRNLQS